MNLSGQWFIAQAISSIRHGIGSGLAFAIARRGERRLSAHRGDSPLRGSAVVVGPAPRLVAAQPLGRDA